MDEVKVTKLINGPEAFTPDNEFCLGETEVARLLRRRRLLRPRPRRRRRDRQGDRRVDRRGRAEPRPLGDGRPPLRRPVPLARPTPTRAPGRPTRPTTTSATRTTSARPAGRCGSRPANAWHREHGAAFGEKSGWERVNWYESNAAGGDESLRPRGWAGRHWSPAIGAEHRATREAVGLFDESSFAKLEIEGPGAAGLLERLCDNRVARDVGQITYTQMLNQRGGIECDFTVARLAEERFSIVTGTAFGNHDREWIRRHLPEDGSGRVRDVTSRLVVLRDLGPAGARRARAADARRTSPTRPSRTCRLRETTVGDVPVRALRVTYVGELGWELYCPTEYGLGPLAGAVGGGRAARDRRRRLPGDRLAAAREGLPRLGRRHHPGRDPVRGRGRLLRQARQGGRLHRPRGAGRGQGARAAHAALLPRPLDDPRSVALGNEPVRVGGEIAGRVTTGGYGYTVERSIAYAYLPPEHAEPGTAVEVEIFGDWVAGEVAAEPLLRPEGRAGSRAWLSRTEARSGRPRRRTGVAGVRGAAVRAGDRLDHGEPEPRSRPSPRAPSARLKRSNAWPMNSSGMPGPSSVTWSSPCGRRSIAPPSSPPPAVDQRVVDQVRQRLLDAQAVGSHRRRVGRRGVGQRAPGALGPGGEPGSDRGERVLRCEGLGLNPQLAVLVATRTASCGFSPSPSQRRTRSPQ